MENIPFQDLGDPSARCEHGESLSSPYGHTIEAGAE